MPHVIAGLANPSVGSRIEHGTSMRVGYVPERFPAPRFRPSEYLRHMAGIQGMDKQEAAEADRCHAECVSIAGHEDDAMLQGDAAKGQYHAGPASPARFIGSG